LQRVKCYFLTVYLYTCIPVYLYTCRLLLNTFSYRRLQWYTDGLHEITICSCLISQDNYWTVKWVELKFRCIKYVFVHFLSSNPLLCDYMVVTKHIRKRGCYSLHHSTSGHYVSYLSHPLHHSAPLNRANNPDTHHKSRYGRICRIKTGMHLKRSRKPLYSLSCALLAIISNGTSVSTFHCKT